jgi:catechol 2,3-dioxygenase
MNLPKPNLTPPFNITRASHVVLTVADLGASRAFYVDALGLIVTGETSDTLYLRGLAEVCHHSLVLKRRTGAPVCERIGLRVFTEDDLERAKHYFDKAGTPAKWVEVPEQGRTLQVSDPFGIPLELCATMTTRPRLYLDWKKYGGGSPLWLDHCQFHVRNAPKTAAYYSELGFRISEYVVIDDKMTSAFMYRKGGPFDMVFFTAPGPRLHHFAYTAPEVHDLIRACDICGQLGFGQKVERGPGRHGPGGSMFVYWRDPDGHRIEFFTNHYMTIDIEVEPVCWDRRDLRAAAPWGLPAQRSWFEEASTFAGVEPASPSEA